MGIRGPFSISWELGPALAPSGCSPVPRRAIPGLTSWLNCRGCLLEQCAELSIVVIHRMLFAFGCSSTYFFGASYFRPSSGFIYRSGGGLFCHSCEGMRMPGSVLGTPCDLCLIVPVCGLGLLKAHASWGCEERLCQCMGSPALCECCGPPGHCHPHLPRVLS